MPKEIYNGEELFRAWCKWGKASGNPRLMEFAKSKYGQASQMGPYTAMWKWAFRNPEQAYPLYKDYHYEKFPEEHQPSREDFLDLLVAKARKNPAIGGGARGLQRFCAKYGLKNEYDFHAGDTVQIVRRDNPLYQSFMIVEEVGGTTGDSQVTGFIVNSNGVRTQHTVSNSDCALVGKAVATERQGIVLANVTKIPKLERIAEDVGTPLEFIEFPQPGDIDQVYRFVYVSRGDDGERRRDYYSYDDFDTGLDEEIERLKSPVPVTMDVV